MEYYIQGDAAKADKIKAAFEKLGVDVLDFGFADKTLVYCSIGECVQCLPYSINLMHILYSHPDYKELELPVEPKFKVGDSLQSGSDFTKILSINLEEGRYYCDNRIISFENQDFWHLLPKPHYDISNFKPFDKVLVRDTKNGTWKANFFSRYRNEKDDRIVARFLCVESIWIQCIPYDGNEHLLGTTDMPDECYINW